MFRVFRIISCGSPIIGSRFFCHFRMISLTDTGLKRRWESSEVSISFAPSESCCTSVAAHKKVQVSRSIGILRDSISPRGKLFVCHGVEEMCHINFPVVSSQFALTLRRGLHRFQFREADIPLADIHLFSFLDHLEQFAQVRLCFINIEIHTCSYSSTSS